MTPFNGPLFADILEQLCKLSNETFDPILKRKIYAFGPKSKTDVEVWNFMKEILDMIVNGSLSTSQVMTYLDVEPYYEPPVGDVYLQKNGSINKAPWRKRYTSEESVHELHARIAKVIK